VEGAVIQPESPEEHKRPRALYAAAAALLAITGLSWYIASRPPSLLHVRYHGLTFRRGQVMGARFMPDGMSVLYTARWDGSSRQLFMVSGSGPESRPMGFADFSLASVSPKAELALMSAGGTANIAGGTLFRVPATGSAPIFADRGVMSADWTRDGQRLVVVRAIDGKNQLEYPSGSVVYRTGGWLSHPRQSLDSDRVAFIEHPFRHDERGRIMLFEPGKGVRVLSDGWVSASGLAWHPGRKEIWFTAAREHHPRSVWAVTMDAQVRPVAQAPGILTLRDIARDGRALVTRDTQRLEMAGRLRGDAAERDLSWLDWSRVQELSGDGRLLLFEESGEAAGNRSMTYLRDMHTDAVTRLAEGMAMGLAPAGELALIGADDRERLALVPVHGGVPQWLPASGLRYQWARFFPDGQRLLALASGPKQGLRLYVQPLDGSAAVPISPEIMIRNVAISPDGRWIAALSPKNELVLYASSGQEPARTIAAGEPLAPLQWMPDGKWLVVQHLRGAIAASAQLSRVELASGRLVPWITLRPSDTVGVNSITGIVLSRDCQSYVYSYRRVLSELFLADGWR
jgi:sugar lactone lactonase YvrE